MHITTKQVLFISIMVNVVLLALYGGLFWWTRSITLETTNLGNDLATQTDRESRLNSVVELVKDTTRERQQLETYFVHKDAVVEIITTIESLGETAELSLDVVSVTLEEGDTATGEDFTSLSVSLSTVGSWEETFHLLALLETLPQAAVVTQFSLSYSSGEGGTSGWNGAVTVEALVSESI